MAQMTEDLLQEVQAFLGGPLAEESAALSAACEQQRKCLLRKLLTIAVGAAAGLPTSAVYLDMNGVKTSNRTTPLIDTTHRNSLKENLVSTEDVVDAHESSLNSGSLENTPKADTCTACSVCTGCDDLFPFEDSQREPSALEAKMAADLLKCGVVWRLWTVPLPLLGRRRRRCWAALFPGRLLLFSSQRSSRPRAVLPLRAACNAAYSARLSTNSLLPNAIELCCPGRKTHQLLVSDSEDALAWLDAIRLAGYHSSKSKPFTSTDTNTRSMELAPTPTPTPSPPSTTNGTASTVSHSEGDVPKPQTPQPRAIDVQQYEPMSSELETPAPPLPTHDEIYHDIAPPPTPPPPEQSQYENGEVALHQGSPPVKDADDQQERPVYDDVGQMHLYKNVPSPDAKSGQEQRTASKTTHFILNSIGIGNSEEIVYDDVGMLNGLPTQGMNAGALYELIDDNSPPCNDDPSS